mmetsp:Transcript_2864/g.7450  ORF Transcript_2864/g.7450 Transcript_2864/m.7450 type:complete len:319 (+) Transcript_2864:66-1022(+)
MLRLLWKGTRGLTLKQWVYFIGNLWLQIFWILRMIPFFLGLRRAERQYRKRFPQFSNIKYGPKARNVLDVYPSLCPAPSPVLIFVHGGAWAWGDKAHYALLPASLTECVVVMPNYTLFPKGKVDDMVDDVSRAVQWTMDHLDDFGGDASRVVLCGHSAGAHLCLLTCMRLHAQPPQPAIGWRPCQLRSLLLLSGVYDIGDHYEWERGRGVHQVSAMARAMGGADRFAVTSPLHQTHLARDMGVNVSIVHGTEDTTVPARQSVRLFEQLKGQGVQAQLSTLGGLNHMDPVMGLMVTKPFTTLLIREVAAAMGASKQLSK